jgi:HEAT repeat protein
MGCQQSGPKEAPRGFLAKPRAGAAEANEAVAAVQTQGVAERQLTRQLKINREALLKGASEQIRIDAASVMLADADPMAREILLGALRQWENSDARVAVCKSLIQSDAAGQNINEKSEFIEPLFEVLIKEDDFGRVKLASEALLIFDYEQKQEGFEKIANDRSLSSAARLNAIYALKLQPDVRAIIKLITMLDDPDVQVATAAEQAVHSLGIPIGTDIKSRKRIVEELRRKGRDAFLRDWLIRQEARMRELETESELWQQRYLAALDKIYGGITDDAARGQALAGYLTDSQEKVRLWALDKVSQWRLGTKAELPAELRPILINLVSDPGRAIRLKTAQLLSLMGQLNSSQRLLQQLETEQDDEVKTQLFIALGGACYYAFLPNSEIRVPEEIRKQTLRWAQVFLFDDEPKKAQEGAEVIKELLELDGLAIDEANRYLGMLVTKYNQSASSGNPQLRSELLGAMSGLCAQSVYKVDAIRLYKPLFEQAVSDESALLREAAVDGLIYIDKPRALKRFRKDLVNDKSNKVRGKLISLAGDVGGAEDLDWLVEKMGSNPDGERVWQAMLNIFQRSDGAVLESWVAKFDSESVGKLSESQELAFLEIAERKAVSENKGQMLINVRRKLADIHSRRGEFERAAAYLGMLRESAGSAEAKEAILADLLGVFLRWPNLEAMKQLVSNRLLEKDLEPNNVIVQAIDGFLAEPNGPSDANSIVKAIAEIEPPPARPMWHEHVERWMSKINQISGPNAL